MNRLILFSRHVTSRHVTSRHVTSRHVTSRHVTYFLLKTSRNVALFCLFSFFHHFSVAGQTCPVPPPSNLILEGTFESCPVDSAQTQDHAINDNCAPPWQAGNGTPSICNHIINYLGIPFDAYEGIRFACISSNSLGLDSCYSNEAMFQTISLCPGVRYQLTFSYYNITLRAGTLFVGLTNGLTNVSGLDLGQPCFPLPSGSDTLLAIAVPATLDSADILGWQTVNITFLATSQTNNQLVFWAYPDITDYEGFNAGLDAISLFCAETPLAPEITVQGECPSYQFTGSTNTIPGVGVASWCWDFGDGTTGTGQQVSHTYAAEGTYTVCLTIADNCGGCIDSVCQVVDCHIEPPAGFACPCLEIGGLNIDAGDPPADPNQSITGLSVLTTALSSGQTVQNIYNNVGKCIAIKGHLRVDNNFKLEIDGGEVRMQPGAKIIVQSGSELTLNGIKEGNSADPTQLGIHGCGRMRRSILVHNGAKLSMSDNIIQDAEYAVDILGNFASAPSFDAIINDFDRNHVGIRINSTVNQPFAFQKNKFRATSGLLPIYSSDINNWDAAHPYAGMDLSVTTFDIGQAGNSVSENLFTQLRNGIVTFKSDVHVYFAKFTKMWGVINYNQAPNWSNLSGFGIAARGLVLTVHDATFDGQGSNGWRAISVSTCNLEAKRNDMINLGSGIYVTPGAVSSINIAENEFRSTIAGWASGQAAFVISGAAPNATINITNNTPIQIRGAGPGILLLNNGVVLNANLRRVSGNFIEHSRRFYQGIFVDNSSRWTVENNHVTYSGFPNVTYFSQPTRGIHLSTSDFCRLIDNEVEATDGSLIGTTMRGIELNGSDYCTLCCNRTDHTTWGNYFMGHCDSTNLQSSELNDHYIGLLCDGIGTVIGDQDFRGNQWLGNYELLGAWHTGSPFNIAGSEFRIELPLTSSLWPPTYDPGDPDVWFKSLLGISGNCVQCPPLSQPGTLEPPRSLTGNEIRIVADTYASSHAFDRTTQREGERELYREMKAHSFLNGQDVNADRFFAVANGNAIGELYEVENLTAHLGDAPLGVQNRMVEIVHLLDSLGQVRNHIDLLYPSAPTSTDSAVLRQQKNACFAAAQLLLEELGAAYTTLGSYLTATAPGILSRNNAIVATDTWIANRKMVNRIYLETVAQDIQSATPQQLSDLLVVANQCLLAGGDAVLQARALYNAFVPTPLSLNDVELCGLTTGERPAISARSSVAATKAYQPSIIPNPAQDRFTVQVQGAAPDASIRVQITGLNGAITKEMTVQNGEVLTHSFSPGLYLCRMYIGDGFAGVVKLIIVP